MNLHDEMLEQRRLLSATLVNGLLVVTGSSRPDQILMFREPGLNDAPVYTVVIQDDTTRPVYQASFPLGQVRAVAVRAGAGDDVVDLAVATFALPAVTGYGPVSVPSRIDGGLDDDVIHGGTSRDMVVDVFGDDRVFGHDGDDWLNGGRGDDFLSGGGGNDFVFGSAGNDTVHGDEGNDRLDGGAGNDHVGRNGVGPMVSEPGDDILFGGSGEDWMVGGSGRDRIFGGPGRDHFSLEDAESEKLDRTPDEPNDVPLSV